ncbi:hypothetical protein [Pseudomonas sp. GM55]|uniref:hypothetical protein n=1 Tax=Pseudomonas sp. GM55 TaxID=1144333 RepID=UPI000270AE5E|nr:hypothetical protein [Pseudomonas sp. GM55]EJM78904.1 hypothetical protein PMI31_00229 [Pseudomonas sp. GM55]
MRKPPMKIIIEEWDGDSAIRSPDKALQELELIVGEVVYLTEVFVGNTRFITDRIDELTDACE